MHRLPNFNKIEQRVAELLTIQQIFPALFGGNFVALTSQELSGSKYTKFGEDNHSTAMFQICGCSALATILHGE